MKIVTIFDENTVLSEKADEISLPEELEQAQIISEQLTQTLKPRMPAAGLAAPQINISKRIFIFSWNRLEEFYNS